MGFSISAVTIDRICPPCLINWMNEGEARLGFTARLLYGNNTELLRVDRLLLDEVLIVVAKRFMRDTDGMFLLLLRLFCVQCWRVRGGSARIKCRTAWRKGVPREVVATSMVLVCMYEGEKRNSIDDETTMKRMTILSITTLAAALLR